MSCDLLPADDASPHHYQADAFDVLDGYDHWDIIIAHPPCTALCVSGNRYYSGTTAREDSVRFVRDLAEVMDDHARIGWAIENPVGVLSSRWRKPTQYVQPYEFGHAESKRTGLWLERLPKLSPTHRVPMPDRGHWDNQTPSGQNRLGPSADRWKVRSKTYQGIADAMALQWGNL